MTHKQNLLCVRLVQKVVICQVGMFVPMLHSMMLYKTFISRERRCIGKDIYHRLPQTEDVVYAWQRPVELSGAGLC